MISFPDQLIDGAVCLQRAHPDHAQAVLAAATPETFSLFTRQPTPWTVDGCREYIEFLLAQPATLPLSLFDAATGELIGGTSYCDIRPQHRGVEIGWTWITPDRRGSSVNPAMKLLLLRHAFEGGLFETGNAIRVQLKTHHRNHRSQAAIEKLGAKREGVLRNHVVMPDGSLRHTVMYSITTDDWPSVRAGLLGRLGGG